MVRVFDVSRCYSSNEQVIFLGCNRVRSSAGRIAITASPLRYFHVRSHSASRILSAVTLCDEKPLPDINYLVGRMGHPVRG
jgi:hypothetical protein